MQKILMATAALMILVTAACTLNDVMPSLQEGMSPTEVKAIMGSPTGQERVGNSLGMTWTNRMISGWGMDRTDAYAIFEDDKLISWGTGDVRQAQGVQTHQMFIWPMR
jgi:hypothetical protein